MVKMTAEKIIQKQIMLVLSANRCTVFRANVGRVRLKDGRYFSTGLPNGHPDLYGFRWKDKQIFYIEVKNEKGRIRADQIQFHEFLKQKGIIHGIARSVEDALKIVNEGLIGYGFKDFKEKNGVAEGLSRK